MKLHIKGLEMAVKDSVSQIKNTSELIALAKERQVNNRKVMAHENRRLKSAIADLKKYVASNK